MECGACRRERVVDAVGLGGELVDDHLAAEVANESLEPFRADPLVDVVQAVGPYAQPERV